MAEPAAQHDTIPRADYEDKVQAPSSRASPYVYSYSLFSLSSAFLDVLVGELHIRRSRTCCDTLRHGSILRQAQDTASSTHRRLNELRSGEGL